MNLERLTVQLGLTVMFFPNSNRTVSLHAKSSFFKPLQLLIRTYQAPLAISRVFQSMHFNLVHKPRRQM